MYAGRSSLPILVSLTVAHGAFLLSLGFFYKIIARFTGKAKRTNWIYPFIAMTIGGLLIFCFLIPNITMRIVIWSGASAILLYTSSYLLVMGKEKRPAAYWFTGFVFAASATVLLIRVIYFAFINPAPQQNLFEGGNFQNLTFLTSYLTSAMLTFGFLLMSYDRYITQHEEAEDKIIQSEKWLNEAQKLAKVGSWEFDLDTGELTWSKEQYHIFEMEETPADKLFEMCRTKIHPDDIAAMDEAIRIGKEKGEGVVYQHRVICKDGSIKHLLGIGETVKSADGKKNILRGTVQDITEQKNAEETNRKFAILESKSKEMEQFAYIASHDLREPLLTIKNYVELLTEESAGKLEADSEEYLTRISRAANRMDELIKGLLDYSRLSKIKELQKADCNEIVREVLPDIHSLIETNRAKISIMHLPTLAIYPLEFKQLFQNLLVNAIKFRRKDTIPDIRISAEKLKGAWTFKVSDNGIGIEETDKEKIFGLFQRVHNRNEYTGSGIGLAYCKKIVELHHGNIWVESVPGKGSSFYFTILTG